VDPRAGVGIMNKTKIPTPPTNRTPVVQPHSPSLRSIPTELSRLHIGLEYGDGVFLQNVDLFLFFERGGSLVCGKTESTWYVDHYLISCISLEL
jgi:hypothetical protein